MIRFSYSVAVENGLWYNLIDIYSVNGTRQIVIGVAVIVPYNALADHLLDEISQLVEENCEAEFLEESREIR